MKKLLNIFLLVLILVFSVIPCVSASKIPDTEAKCSITVDCGVPGYTYTIYQVGTLDEVNTASSNNATYLVDDCLSMATPNNTTRIDEEDLKDFFNNLEHVRQWRLNNDIAAIGTFTSKDDLTSTVYTNLSPGLYYIRLTDAPNEIISASPVGLAVPYYDEDNSEWVYNSSVILSDNVTEVPEMSFGKALAISVLVGLSAGIIFMVFLVCYAMHRREQISKLKNKFK